MKNKTLKAAKEKKQVKIRFTGDLFAVNGSQRQYDETLTADSGLSA